MKKTVLSLACIFGSLLTTAQTGAALNFSGVSDYVQLTDPNYGTSDFTLETWMKPNTTNSAYIITTRSVEMGGAGNWFVLGYNSGKIGLEVGSAGLGNFYFETAGTPVTVGAWNHVAVVRSGLQFSIFVNGTLSASYTDIGLRNFITGTNSIRLSGWPNVGVAYFNGMMDETRFWNVARTACQINTFMNCEIPTTATGLIGNYHYNQGVAAGTNSGLISLTDVSGSARTGTLNNFTLAGAVSNWVTPGGVVSGFTTTLAPPVMTVSSGVVAIGSSYTLVPSGGVTYTYTPSGPVVSPTVITSYTVTGKAATGCTNTAVSTVSIQGAALDFDGVNDFVNCGNIMPATYSKEAWIYITNLGLQNNIISGGVDGQHAFYPSTTNGNRLSAGHNGTWNSVMDPTPMVANTWYHVALTYDAATTTMKLYKNGILVSFNASVPPFIGGNALRIGAFDPIQNLFGGKLDEVRVWNRVLCQSEIQNNKNAELPSGQVGLVAYYKMNQGVASFANPTVTSLTDFSGNVNNGTLSNFALTGLASNWVVPGAVVTGSLSPAFASPTVSIAGVNTICNGTPTTFTASGASTYAWFSGQVTSTITVTPSVITSYTVVGTNAAGCTSGMIVKTLTVNATPTISVNSETICVGQSFTMVPTGALTYTYSSGSNIVSPTVNTTYTVTGTNINGCVGSALSIGLVNALPIVSVNSSAICSGASFTMVPSGGITYTYSNGSSVASPTVNSTYSVTGTDSNGCIGSTVSSVTVNSLPTITVNSGTTCSGSSFTFTPSGGITYTYSNGSSVATPTANSTYSVTGTDINGCIGSTVSSVTVNSLPTIAINSGAICSGASFTMVPSGANTYTYSNGSDIATPTINATYTVTGTDINGCIGSTVSSVTVNALPTITVNSGAICSGASFTMVPSGANTYTYSNGSDITTPTINATYTVTGTDINGCIGSTVSSVTVNALPLVMASTNNTLLCSGQTATLTASGATSYTWNTAAISPFISVSPTTTVTYTVNGTDANGCENVTTVTQNVSLCTDVVTLSNNNKLISLYPNPSNGIFTIDLTTPSKVFVINTFGQVVIAETMDAGKNVLNICNEATGVYFVKIIENNNQQVIKLIKE